MDLGNLSQGREFVRKARQRGLRDFEIARALLAHGWTKTTVQTLSHSLALPLAVSWEALDYTEGPPPPTEPSITPASLAGNAAGSPPSPPQSPPSAAPPAPLRPRRDLETVIGTMWLTRIGMIAVLLAVAYLLKHAYSQGWITEQMLVAVGMVAGLAILAGGEYAHHKGYVIQSQALTGGGAAMLYLTLWAGQHLYGLLGSATTFPLMAVVTLLAAAQAIRHESETVATFAWVTGYLVPLLLGGGGGGSAESGGPGPLFAYLSLLSVAVFVVAQRYPWPTFTGMALLGAYSSGVYIFRVSGGALAWTLTYLMLVTAGILWVSVSRQGREGENFGAVGAIAGYLVTGVVLMTGASGSPFVPYMYLLALSGCALWLGHTQDWRAMRWLGALGSFAGFLLLLPVIARSGLVGTGNWMLLYAAMCVSGTLAVSAGRGTDAEPLALSAVGTAYAAIYTLVYISPSGAVSGGAVFAFLTLLAGAVLVITVLFPWRYFSAVGISAAFLATGLVAAARVPGLVVPLPLVYLVLVGAGALLASVYSDTLVLGVISVLGVYVGLVLSGMVEEPALQLVVPGYLVVAALGCLAAIERRAWHGLEWAVLGCTWVVYLLWRLGGDRWGADLTNLRFTSLFLLAFVGAAWLRHGVHGVIARETDAAFACANAAVFFLMGCHDLVPVQGAGPLALVLTVLYAFVGVTGVLRRPEQKCFGPVHVGLAVLFLTGAMPLLVDGYRMTILWAAEVVVVVALGCQFRSKALRDAGLIVLMLPVMRTILVDSQITREGYQWLVNSRGLSMLTVAAALYLCAYLYAGIRDRLDATETKNVEGLATLATILLFWVSSAEIWSLVGWQLGLDTWAQHFALSGVWITFGAVFMGIGMVRDAPAFRYLALVVLGVTVLKVLCVDPLVTANSYVPLVHHRVAPLLLITALLYGLGAWYLVVKRKDVAECNLGMGVVASATGLLLWIVSSETWLFVGWWLGYGLPVQHFALSGVWVAFSVALMAVGIAGHNRACRWAALGLLGVTVLKILAGEPPLSTDTYLPIVNAHAAPLLVIALIAFAASVWYRRSEETEEIEKQAATGLLIVGVGLLLWVFSVEAWLFTGWSLGYDLVTQHAALSGVWLAFGLALLLIGMWQKEPVLRCTAFGLFAATALKVFGLDPPLVAATYLPLVNPHAAPLLIVALVLLAAYVWEGRNQEKSPAVDVQRACMAIAAAGLLLWVASSEGWMYLGWRTEEGLAGQQMCLSMVWLIFACMMLLMGMKQDNYPLRGVGLTVLVLVAVKVLVVDPGLNARNYVPLANFHALPLLLVAGMLFVLSHWYRRTSTYVGDEESLAGVLPYAGALLLLWVLTTEAWYFADWGLHGGRDAQQYALSMVWAAYGAILATVGLIRDNPPLRWIAMALLGVTVLKVSFLDLREVDIFYRILTLLCVGIVLIAVGFAYQRLVREQDR
ncbi:DUF2339 domain-containing protein [bacterium]|nr:DUF2339 domain-containing protein [bacterium]